MIRVWILLIAVVGLTACQQETSSPQAQQPAVAETEKTSQMQVTEKREPEPVAKAGAVVEKAVEKVTEEAADTSTPAPAEKSVDAPAVTSEAAMVSDQSSAMEEAVVEAAPAVVAKGDAQRGEKLSRKCAACHTFDQGGKNKTGPNLFGIFGARKGAVAGFRYGDYLKSENSAGATWDADSMRAWLDNSKTVAKAAGSSTKMAPQRISGEKADDLIAYLKTLK
jgi:cytochrome c